MWFLEESAFEIVADRRSEDGTITLPKADVRSDLRAIAFVSHVLQLDLQIHGVLPHAIEGDLDLPANLPDVEGAALATLLEKGEQQLECAVAQLVSDAIDDEPELLERFGALRRRIEGR